MSESVGIDSFWGSERLLALIAEQADMTLDEIRDVQAKDCRQSQRGVAMYGASRSQVASTRKSAC
jgi:hypothetical protein